MTKCFQMVALVAGIAGATHASAQTSPQAFAELDRGAFALFVRIAVKPETRDEFLAAMKSRVAQSRTVDGVVDFRLLSTGDPAVFALFESFQSKTAFDAFATAPESVAFLQQLKPHLAAPLEAQVLNRVP